MQSCLRELCFVAATAEFEVKAVHIPGRLNTLPDLLSRWHLSSTMRNRCMQLLYEGNFEIVPVDASLFQFTCAW